MMAGTARLVLVIAAIGAIYLAVGPLTQFRREGCPCELPAVVEVLNGCGRAGIADKVASHLRDCGFDVMYVDNADDFKYDKTLVVARTGDGDKAHAVAAALGQAPVVHQVSSTFFVDVTVVVGGDVGTLCGF
jgi:predicted GTPase